MDGSPSTIVSLGFGSWGSVNLIVTLGYGIAAAPVVTAVHPWEPVLSDRDWEQSLCIVEDNWTPILSDRNWKVQR